MERAKLNGASALCVVRRLCFAMLSLMLLAAVIRGVVGRLPPLGLRRQWRFFRMTADEREAELELFRAHVYAGGPGIKWTQYQWQGRGFKEVGVAVTPHDRR